MQFSRECWDLRRSGIPAPQSQRWPLTGHDISSAHDDFMAWRASYASARSAVERAVTSLDADNVRNTLRKFPVLRIHACDALCRNTKPFHLYCTDRQLFAKLVRVLGALLSRYAASACEDRLCSNRLVKHFRKGKTKLLQFLIQQMSKDELLSEGCGLFVVCCLEQLITSSSDEKDGLEETYRYLRTHGSKLAGISCSSKWSEVYMRMLQHDSAANSADGIEQEGEERQTDTYRQGAALKRPRLFIAQDQDRNCSRGKDRSVSHHARNGCFEYVSEFDCLLEVVSLWAVCPGSVLCSVYKNGTAQLISDLIFESYAGEARLMNRRESTLPASFKVHALALLHKLLAMSGNRRATPAGLDVSLGCWVADVRETEAADTTSRSDFSNYLANERTISARMHEYGSTAMMRANPATGISKLTKDVVRSYLVEEDKLNAEGQLYNWMPGLDVRDALYGCIKAGGITLHMLQRFWSAARSKKGASSEQTSRVDQVIVSVLRSDDILAFLLANSNLISGGKRKDDRFCPDSDETRCLSQTQPTSAFQLLEILERAVSDADTNHSSFWHGLRYILSVLEERFIWELCHWKFTSPKEQRNDSNDHRWFFLCTERLRSSCAKRIRTISNTERPLNVCICGAVRLEQNKDSKIKPSSFGYACLCGEPEWMAFERPRPENWFLWSATEEEGCMQGELNGCVQGSLTASEWIFLTPISQCADVRRDSDVLFVAVCTALLRGILGEERVNGGGPIRRERLFSKELQQFLCRLMSDVDLSSKANIFQTMESCLMAGLASKEEMGENSSLLDRSKLSRSLRIGVETIWLHCALGSTLHTFLENVDRELESVERILRIMFQSLDDLEDSAADAPSFLRAARFYIVQASQLCNVRRPELMYACVLLSFVLVLPKSAVQQSNGDELSTHILRCFTA